MRIEGYGSWVSQSVHPYVMFIHPTNDVAHLTGNEGLCGAHGYTCSHVHKPHTMLIGQRNVVSDSASFSLLNKHSH